MSFKPKWKYRKAPDSGAFQAVRVMSKEADRELSDWVDDPSKLDLNLHERTHEPTSELVWHEVPTVPGRVTIGGNITGA